MLLAGCGSGESDDPADPDITTTTFVDGPGPVRDALGEILVSSFQGPVLPDYLRKRLRAGETTGVILFGGNAPSAESTRSLTRAIQRSAGGRALIATDQEGGAIRSLVFANTSSELRAAGVNVNLAPVADVAQPGSVMAGRTFDGDVAAQTAAASKELMGKNVMPTLKHFPGLGRAMENTDDSAVTIDATRAALETDLEPFRAGIEAGAPIVMASHALYPALDPDHIASQSPVILDKLLRGDLGFDGVVITDSLEAEAVLSRSSVEVAAERSLAAGADLLLMTGQGSWIHVYPYLLKRAKHSPALRNRIREASYKVKKLKQLLGLLD